MAYLWGDSFDFYNGAADLQLRYPGAAINSMYFVTTTQFGSGQALAWPVNNSSSISANWGSNEPTIYFSIRFKSNTSTGSVINWTLLDGGSGQCQLRFSDTGQIQFFSGNGSVLATFPAIFASNSWFSLQGKIIFNNTTGSIELRTNGATSTPAGNIITNINTCGGTGNNYANGFSMTTGYGSANDIFETDDLLIWSPSGAAPNGWLGDVRAVQQLPTGQTQAQFAPTGATNNWQCVTEALEDGDATYVSSSTVGAEDIYTLSAIPTTYAVVGVTYLADWRKTDAGPRTGALLVAANGSGDTQILSAALGAAYGTSRASFMPLDPTSAAWTPATVNGALLGVKVAV